MAASDYHIFVYTFESYIYITNGYEKPVASTTKPSAMSVMVEGYKIFVDDAEVSGLMAGDDVTLKITLKNNAKFDTSYKNVATISLVNSMRWSSASAAATRTMFPSSRPVRPRRSSTT